MPFLFSLCNQAQPLFFYSRFKSNTAPDVELILHDVFGYNVVRDPVHVYDLHATILHLLGIDHERLIHRHQGRRYRLTEVHGNVVDELIG